MTILWIAIGAAVWLACGLLAVGMARYDFAVAISPERKYGPSKKLQHILLWGGPVGLLTGVFVCVFDDGHWGLKYRYDE